MQFKKGKCYAGDDGRVMQMISVVKTKSFGKCLCAEGFSQGMLPRLVAVPMDAPVKGWSEIPLEEFNEKSDIIVESMKKNAQVQVLQDDCMREVVAVTTGEDADETICIMGCGHEVKFGIGTKPPKVRSRFACKDCLSQKDAIANRMKGIANLGDIGKSLS